MSGAIARRSWSGDALVAGWKNASRVLVLAEIEEIAITFVLPRRQSNVRSFGRALELRGEN